MYTDEEKQPVLQLLSEIAVQKVSIQPVYGSQYYYEGIIIKVNLLKTRIALQESWKKALL